jgi:threonine/homoserine/homoserine lactone efflux protein
LHVCGAAVGVSAILMASATAFVVVKAAGAVYLVVLGVMAMVGSRREDGPRSLGDEATPRALGQGVVTELLNPKTALFFLTFLPQFVQPARGPVAVQMGVLGIVTVLLNSSTDLLVVGLGSRLRAALQRHPRLWRRQRVASGVVLVGLGAYAATGQRS